MKITKFDKPTLKDLRPEIDAALAPLAAKYGIKLTAGNASFQANNVTFKLNGTIIDSSGNAKTQERMDLEALHPDLVDKKVSLSGGVVGTIVGYKTRAKKYPFLVRTSKGVYKISYDKAMA